LYGREVGFTISSKPPRRHRASARAVTFGWQSLVWPGTSSARGGSFLARPGTCRASPAAPLGVPTAARRLLPLSPLQESLFASLVPAAASDPCVPVGSPLHSRAGLVHEAAVGRACAECG